MSSQLNRNPEKQFETQEATLFDRIFRDSKGNIVIAQMPNLPALVGVAATLLYFILPSGGTQKVAALVAFGALFTWAWEELFQGVNYFRRALGLLSLLGLIALGLNFSAVWVTPF